MNDPFDYSSSGYPARALRWAGILWGILFLVWLPFEDLTTTYPVLLAAGLSLWLGARAIYLTPGPSPSLSDEEGRVPSLVTAKRGEAVRWFITGLRLGFVVPFIAVFLMVFKGGLHAHGFPDFVPAQISAVLRSAPWWALAGAIIGIVARRLRVG